jgi:hypothetical protein
LFFCLLCLFVLIYETLYSLRCWAHQFSGSTFPIIQFCDM